MADESLKKQLVGLFSDLEKTRAVDSLLALIPTDSPEEPEPLLGLFSGSELEPEQYQEATWPAEGDRVSQVEADSRPGLGEAGVLARRQVRQIAADDDIVKLLRSKEADDRCLAIEALTRAPDAWAVDPLLYAATDAEQQVVQLALQALIKIHALLKSRLLSLCQQEVASPLHRGSEIYLSYLLGQPLIHIPAGAFLMGSHPKQEPMADSNEQPQHQLLLPGYWIGRYPVTVAQYQLFLQESGYRPRGDAAQYGQSHYPVVDVTWADALACCDWLSERSALPVTLPSEAEWEKAARGTDGRRYPWGNDPPTEALCNFKQATPVGHYSPQGDSPYGCADMAGNVWEWTRSIYKPYPYHPKDGREELAGERARVVRGLTFNNAERLTRCASRYNLKPVLHLRTLGFRVVLSPGFSF